MRRSGYTLVEAIVSVVILAVGIVAALGALNEMTRTESRMRESDLLRRLAQSKLDEVLATDEISQAPLDGDFGDQGRSDVSYSVETEPATVENMLVVRTKVYFTTKGEDSATRLTTMVLQAPEVQEQGGGN